MASHSNRVGGKESLFFPYTYLSPVNDEHFRVNNPANRTPKKRSTLPPSLLSRRPSIHRFNIAIEKPTHEKKRRLTTYKNHAMKPNPSHSILFYDERETNDRSLILNFKTKKKIRKFENKKSIEKKRYSCEFDLFICCTYTYIHTLVPTYYTYMRSFCPLSLSLSKKTYEFFFWILPPKEKSER